MHSRTVSLTEETAVNRVSCFAQTAILIVRASRSIPDFFASYAPVWLVGPMTILALSWPAQASWRLLGPSTGRIAQIRFDPHDDAVVYAGTEYGVFKSTDGGASWFSSNRGAPYAYVTALAVDPIDTQQIWMALTIGNTCLGVFHSADGGSHWEAASNGLDPCVDDLAVHPRTAGTVFAATAHGVFRTTDAGFIWVVVGLVDQRVGAVTFNATAPETLYAGADSDGPYRSTNGGDTWERAANGYAEPRFALFNDLAAAETRGSWAYTCGWSYVYRTMDAAESWTHLTALPEGAYYSALAVQWPSTAPGPIVYAPALAGAIYRSTDGGDSFTDVAPPAPPGVLVEYQAVAMAPGQPERVLVGAIGGELIRSENGGQGWDPATHGLALGVGLSVAVEGPTLLLGTSRGLYFSPDQGTTWEYTDFLFDVGATVFDVAFAPRAERAFATIMDAFHEGNILRSSGDWRHWDIVYHTDGPATSVAIDQQHPDTLYVGYDWDLIPGAVVVSHDGGANWFERSLGEVGVLSTYAPPGSTALAYAGTDKGLFRSTDAGDSWSPAGLGGDQVWDLVALPGNPQFLFAATGSEGVWRSEDGGDTWQPWSEGLPTLDVRALEIPSRTPGAIYVGTASRGVHVRPVDGSRAWWHYGPDTEPHIPSVRDLASTSGAEGNLLAATAGASLWSAPLLRDPTPVLVWVAHTLAEPGRAHLEWETSQPNGFAATVMRAPADGRWFPLGTVSPGSGGRIVYVDTTVPEGGRYGYRLDVHTEEGIVQAGEVWLDIPNGLRLLLSDVQPNPARGDLVVSFSLADSRSATLELLTVDGRRVLTRLLHSLPAGSHAITWEKQRALPSGVYILRLAQGSRSASKKIVLLND